MKFTPDARHDSGCFQVLIIETITKMDLAVTLPKIYSGRHITHPAVSILTGRDVKIDGATLPIMLDGDIFPSRPLQVKIIPQATRLLIPKAPVL